MLTLIVTPSMLMIFTRDKRKAGQKGWLGRLKDRLFRRRKTTEAEAPAATAAEEPEIEYAKAAE